MTDNTTPNRPDAQSNHSASAAQSSTQTPPSDAPAATGATEHTSQSPTTDSAAQPSKHANRDSEPTPYHVSAPPPSQQRRQRNSASGGGGANNGSSNHSSPNHRGSNNGGSSNGGSGKRLKQILLIALVLGFLGFVIYGLMQSQDAATQPAPLQGQMDMQQTAIAAKVAGRVAKVMVTEGDSIEVGQQLIEMDSPEINAKMQQAQAAKQMAQSQLDKANNGARPQEIAQARAGWQANQAAADLAKSTYERVNRLYEEGLMARQKRDEAYTQYVANQDKAEASRQQYEMALEGTREEDIAAAAAQVEQADGKVQEANVAKEEANLKSPINGIVDDVIVNDGEVVGQGVPLMNVVNPNDQWVVINVTENYLSQFAIGKTFTGTIPALSSADASYTQRFTVFASSALSDFATWRPTNNDDGFDVRTFEVKARPESPNPNVRSGMSVLVDVAAADSSTH